MAARSGIHGMLPEGLERVLDQFTLYQLCRHRLAQEDLLFLPLPLSFLDEGYMLAERERRQGDEESADAEESGPCWKMRLHLKLSVLGSLEIKLLFEGKTLRMRVLCESEETAAMVGRAIPRLSERLSTVNLKGFSAAAGARDPGAHLVKMLAPDGEHFLEAQV
jgi:hypothetical protein